MECRHTLRQIATAAWVCARVGRRCAALIKVFVRPPVRPLLLLYRSAATTRQTSITVDSAAESAHKGPVWLVNVLTLATILKTAARMASLANPGKATRRSSNT
ncbi:hypothetical protein WJX79_003433 [Trebouxia sp. C0005]